MKRITYEKAEAIVGERLDRRRAYYYDRSKFMREYLEGGPVYTYDEWTTSCSGCFETEDGHPVGHYPWDAKYNCHVGGGCDECGYTGKRRDGIHTPVCRSNVKGEPTAPGSSPKEDAS